MKKEKRKIKDFLKRIKELEIEPNFYISRPYLKLSNVKCYSCNGWIWIEGDKWAIVPPIPDMDFPSPYLFNLPIWSDFKQNIIIRFLYEKKFLDYEYLFDPKDFLDLSGKKWEVFRKNKNKWLKRNPYHQYRYSIHPDYINIQILLGSWLEFKKEDITDVDFIVKYIPKNTTEYKINTKLGIHYKFLAVQRENSPYEIIGINAWDENWKYINYRFCIINPREDYLSEYMRFLFYTDPEIQNSGKLINDGGTLGLKGLERFKDKLNPVQKRKVFSWIKIYKNSELVYIK